MSEPFEYFSFVEKPFDREQLISAIRDAMAKAKKHPQTSTVGSSSAPVDAPDIEALTTEIEQLKLQVVSLKKESEQMKKQFNQLVSFIKQKMK